MTIDHQGINLTRSIQLSQDKFNIQNIFAGVEREELYKSGLAVKMFWNLTAALSGNGPKVAKFLDR